MVGVCPFHDDHRPSMYVNGDKQIFKCFACGAGGSVFTFVQMRENLGFPQAVERLAQRAGIKLARVQSTAKRSSDIADIDPNLLAKVNNWAAEHFCKNLLDKAKGKYALDYVTERKISQDSIKKWQIGLALDSRDDLIGAADRRGIGAKLLKDAGLVVGGRDGRLSDKFVNRLIFTITDVTGRTIGFGGRTLGDDNAKYINSPTTVLFDKSNSVYGLEQARHEIVSTGTAVVVEGYTDCIMAHQCGCSNVVATLGTSFTSGHTRILRRYAKKIVLVFDSDTAGLEAANRALEICLAQKIDIAIAKVPEGQDPCDFLVENGKEKFEEVVEQATDVFEFKWNRLKENFAKNSNLIDNRAAVEEFLQAVATGISAGNLSAIDRGLIVNQLSRIIGLGSKEINAELRQRIRKAERSAANNRQRSDVEQVDFGRGLFAAAQREILEVLLNEPKLFEVVKQKIGLDVFDVPILSQIASLVFAMLSKEPNASLSDVLSQAESVTQANAIVELERTGREKKNFESRLAGALEAVEQHRNRQAKNGIQTTEDDREFLKRFSENSGRDNPRSIGMV
jgi:DNA primase